MLTDFAGAIAQVYTFSAYGVMVAVHNGMGSLVGTTAAAAHTSLGYSGEHFDAKAQQQYLRARFYNQTNGRFNRLDPFNGNNSDPQSFHKYAYAHGDPTNNWDPTGKFSVAGLGVGMAIGFTLGYMDATIAGKGTGEAVLEGIFGGIITGIIGGFAVPGFAILQAASIGKQIFFLSYLAVIMAYQTHIGVQDAIAQGNPDLATFRQSVGWLSLLLLPFAARPYSQRLILARATAPRGTAMVAALDAELESLWGGVPRLVNGYGAGEPAAGANVATRTRLSALTDGIYKFVIDLENNVWLIDSAQTHSSMVPKGAEVKMAGWTAVRNGKATFTGKSGHYMENGNILAESFAAAEAAVRETFLKHGVTVTESTMAEGPGPFLPK